MLDGVTYIVALTGHSMTGEDVQGVFEHPYVFFIAWDHDGMYGFIGREHQFLLLRAG